MKKALAVGLSLLLIVTAILALSLSGSAAANNATEVKITPSSGSAVTLKAGNTSVTMGTGTVSFDPATGTLTMDGASGIKMITATGNVTVLLKGVNTITSTSNFTMNIAGSTTFTGDGTLNMNGFRGIYSSAGDLIARDSVKINIDVIDYPYSVRSASTTDGNMVFEDSAQVYVKVKGLGLFQHASTNAVGTTTISDSASVTVESANANKAAVSLKNGLVINGGSLTVTSTGITAEPTLTCGALTQNGGTVSVTANTPATVAVNCTAFKQTNGTFSVSAQNTSTDGLACTGFEKTGGDMTVTVAGNASQYKIQGIKIVGNDSTVVTFGGGNLTVNMSSAMTGATDVHAMYLHHVAAANFSGTDVTLNVTTPKAGNYSSAILTGWTKAINITGGKIVANLNDKTTGLICPRYGKDEFALTVSGGTVTGTAPSLLNTAIGGDTGSLVTTAVAVKVLDGAKINLATAGGVFSSANQYTVDTSASTSAFVAGYGFDSSKGLVTANMADEINCVDVYDTAGVKTVLNKQNPTMTAGSGTIVFDPAAMTLTLNNATARKIYCTAGDLKIIAKGTNTLTGTEDFLVYTLGCGVTFAGDGILNIETTGMAVYASGGDLIAEDSVTLNVSGNSLVYCVKNGDATDGNMIFRDDAKVTVNGTGYQAILQNEASPYNPNQKLLVEDNAKVEVNIPNASSGASNTYTTAILIRGLEMTGGSLTLNHTGAADASSRALGIQVQSPNQNGAVNLTGGKLTINHVSQNPGQNLAYSLYTYHSSGITFGGTEVVINLTSAKGGSTSAVICPAVTPFVKITGGSVTVNANDKTTALITPRLANTWNGFTFEMTGGTLTGTVPSLLNTNNDSAGPLTVKITTGAKIKLNTPAGALSAHKGVTVNTSGTTATFLEGCGLEYGNEYLITSDMFTPGQILTGVTVTDANGTTTLNYGHRVYYGSVGRIVLDPEAKTLLFDGIVGPTAVSVPGSVDVTLVGTNVIKGTSNVLTVDGDLTLQGTGSLELNGVVNLISADNLKVKDATLRGIGATNALRIDGNITLSGTADLRLLTESGTALTTGCLSVTEEAEARIYADNGFGISADTVKVLADGKLTVDAKSEAVYAETMVLAGNSVTRLYANLIGMTVSGAEGITVSDTARLTVEEDADGARGVVLDGSSLKVSSTGSVTVSVTGVGISRTADASSISVTDAGTVEVDGINAIDKTVTVTAAYIKGGEGRWNAYLQDSIEGTENYILLSAQNPGGSFRPADYTAVNAAIANANALNKDLYKDFTAVTAAINAVVTGKDVTEQAAVDAMAKAINDAVAALEYKDADYAAVNAAIAAANALDKNLYKDFTAVTNAVNAVVRGKKINEQAAVDAMAKAINDAVAALEYKDADYSAVNAAIAAANALDKNLYKDFTAVTAAINAVVTGKDVTEQAAVDAMAKAINDAVAGLSVKDPVSDTDSSGASGSTDRTDSVTSSGSAGAGESNPSTSDVAVTASVILLLCAVFVAMTLTLKKRNG